MSSDVSSDESDMCSDVRIGELILLESMFPKQCQFDDLEVQTAVKQENYGLIYDRQITCTFSVDKHLDLIIGLARDYPKQAVSVHCRVIDGTLPNSVQKSLNDSINRFIIDCNQNDFVCDVVTVIQRAQELWTDLDLKLFVNTANSDNNYCTNERTDTGPNDEEQGLSRYWIYSHHIKSIKKRQMIIDLAKELHLNGFTCVGKPGFICVEGLKSGCEQFWTTIRATNWQRITLIETEHNLPDISFDDYNELSDTSNLFRLLESKKCQTIIKNFLGFQSATSSDVIKTTAEK